MIRLLAAAALFVLLVVGIRAQSDQATITITTNGATATTEVYGGDVGYPGPSQVVLEHDSLGMVVVSRTRVFDTRRSWVYLPMVQQ